MHLHRSEYIVHVVNISSLDRLDLGPDKDGFVANEVESLETVGSNPCVS